MLQSSVVKKHSKLELLSLLEEKHKRLARVSFRHFATWMRPSYEMHWHHALICDELQKLADGLISKLAIFMPPQHGKSELVSRLLPAFMLGRYADKKIAGCSYNTTFAQGFSRDVQRVIDSSEYRDVFPDTLLSGSKGASSTSVGYVRTVDEFELVGHLGGYRSAGVGSALTGFKVDFGIIDDPIKDRAEAESDRYRERVWDWYMDVFDTRLHKDSQQLLTMTRWHHDDIAGRLRLEETGWRVLTLPRLYESGGDAHPKDPREDGETLWPSRHSREKAEEIRDINPYGYSSLQQQRPSIKGGGVLKVGGCSRYDTDSIPQLDQVILSIDCNAKKGLKNDATSIQAWGKVGVSYYLLDDLTKNMGFTEMVANTKKMVDLWSPTAVLIEDKANGPAVIDTIKQTVAGIIAINPIGGKIARAEAISELFSAGNTYIPVEAPWLGAWLEEVAAFPSAKKDDRVDACTQALAYLHIRKKGYLA